MRTTLIATSIAAGLLCSCSRSGLIAGMQSASLPEGTAEKLANASFVPAPIVAIQGKVARAEFLERGLPGMLVVDSDQPKVRYLVQLLPSNVMARQGFTRLSVKMGQRVIITAAADAPDSVVEGFTAARMQTISAVDGKLLLARAEP